MAYTIKNTDGTTLLILGDAKIDTNSTSLTLVGKNFSTYGEIWNNNLIKLMGNFSNSSAPNGPIKGQLWYDSVEKKLNVYDNGWEPLNGAQVSNTAPNFLSEGDLWWDSVNDQMYIHTDSGNKLVGPTFSSVVGSNGWVLPANPIQDNSSGATGNVKQVTLLRNYGTALGLIANEQFFIATTSTNAYITNYTTSTVKGLTVLGDIKATDTLYANTLTVTTSVVYPRSERISRIVDVGVAVEINNIAFKVRTPGGTAFYPQIGTVSGTASVSWSGWYVKNLSSSAHTLAPVHSGGGSLGDPAVTISNINTTPTDIIGATNLSDIGDMIQLFVSDQTVDTSSGIKTYRVTIQLTGAGPKVSITLEKLT